MTLNAASAVLLPLAHPVDHEPMLDAGRVREREAEQVLAAREVLPPTRLQRGDVAVDPGPGRVLGGEDVRELDFRAGAGSDAADAVAGGCLGCGGHRVSSISARISRSSAPTRSAASAMFPAVCGRSLSASRSDSSRSGRGASSPSRRRWWPARLLQEMEQ